MFNQELSKEESLIKNAYAFVREANTNKFNSEQVASVSNIISDNYPPKLFRKVPTTFSSLLAEKRSKSITYEDVYRVGFIVTLPYREVRKEYPWASKAIVMNYTVEDLTSGGSSRIVKFIFTPVTANQGTAGRYIRFILYKLFKEGMSDIGFSIENSSVNFIIQGDFSQIQKLLYLMFYYEEWVQFCRSYNRLVLGLTND
jgi:hypothetical protein